MYIQKTNIIELATYKSLLIHILVTLPLPILKDHVLPTLIPLSILARHGFPCCLDLIHDGVIES